MTFEERLVSKQKESRLEKALREQIAEKGLPEPVQEYRFHPTRRWRFDLAWPDYHVAVEVDGAVWVNGRHNRGSGFTKDQEKFNEATLLGWWVIRVSSEHIKEGQALAWIVRALHPSRAHRWEGE